MSKFTTALTGTVLWFFVPLTSLAQQADAPVYKDGDWWRVEVDVARPAGVSVAGSQFGGSRSIGLGSTRERSWYSAFAATQAQRSNHRWSYL